MPRHPDIFSEFFASFPNAKPEEIRALLTAGSTAERLVAMTALCPETNVSAQHQAAINAHS